MIQKVICTCCPRGCHLQVSRDPSYNVIGNHCPKGREYGIDEVTQPKRTVTSTVATEGGSLKRLPVRTDRPIDRRGIANVMVLIQNTFVKAPIRRGDVILENIVGSGANLIACRDLICSPKNTM